MCIRDSCSPNAKEPSEITVLGGTKMTVLPTAMDSLSKFKPGDQMTLLLTEDGRVAGAVEATGSSAPVSYTHLDVYKRQAKGGPQREKAHYLPSRRAASPGGL